MGRQCLSCQNEGRSGDGMVTPRLPSPHPCTGQRGFREQRWEAAAFALGSVPLPALPAGARAPVLTPQ